MCAKEPVASFKVNLARYSEQRQRFVFVQKLEGGGVKIKDFGSNRED